MPNAIVKNVLVSLILVVLCIVIGAQAAESKDVALGIIIALVGGCFLLWLGQRCWVLIFLVPPVMTIMPLPGVISVLPVEFLVGLLVLFYWFVMWGMGYVKFCWRGLLTLDLIVFVMCVYMAISYVRYPVSLAIFGYESDYVGGKEYVFCFFAVLYYLSVSCIPCSYGQIVRVLRWTVRLSIVALLLVIGSVLMGYAESGIETLQEHATGGRFALFSGLGMYGLYIVYGQYPMSRVLLNPGYLCATFFSCVAILLSGWREVLLSTGCITIALSYIKRELWCLMLVLLAIYGTVLYLSSEGLVKEFPYGIQRCLSILPGIEVSSNVESSSSHSSEWRKEMWSWALDSRTRYINDYVWGDGFGISVDYLRIQTTASMRQGSGYDLREQLARTGMWHNGAITAVHRLGYVGLGIITIIYIYVSCLVLRVCRALRDTPLYLPSLFLILPYLGQPALFYISAGTIIKFFQTFVAISLAKFLYCVAREQGLIVPWHLRKHYVPLAIQAHEERIRPAEL